MIGHRPAHHPAAEGVDDDREEQESGPGRHVGDVGDPELVGCIGFESTLDEVRCPTSGVVSARSARPLAPRYPCQTHLSHQSSYALASDVDTVSGELGVNARRPVGTTAALMNVADARLEHIVALPAPRRLAVSPRVEPARGDAEHAGHRGGAVAGLIRSHELERFPGTEPVSRANQAAAFASISRSSRNRRFSRRRRRSSSRASSRIARPERTSSTIWRRNSGGYGRCVRGIVDSSSPKGSVSTKTGQLHANYSGRRSFGSERTHKRA